MSQKCLCLNPGWRKLERGFPTHLPRGPLLLTAPMLFLAQPWPILSALDLNSDLPRALKQETSFILSLSFLI